VGPRLLSIVGAVGMRLIGSALVVAQGTVQANAERVGEDIPGHASDERDMALGQEGEDGGQTGRDRRSSSHHGTGKRGKGAIYSVRLCTTMDQVRVLRLQTPHTIRIQFIILGFIQTAITDAPRRAFQRPSNDFQRIFARVNFEEQAVRSIQVAFTV